uniref:Uncharacterized protein n=1 Tax=viral metagenome TaxID=1070528 RepID=A0A6C0AS64_9ZZZZ
MSDNNDEQQVPEEFIKVIRDFVGDLSVTFPEYASFIQKWWKNKEHFDYIEEQEDRLLAIEKSEKKSAKLIFEFCQKKIPPRFFDILYQNEDIFKEDSDFDTEFLPQIHFKNLWQCDISDKTRETIWKYLQLITFSIVGTLENKEAFGDTAKLFEAINEDEFKGKLEETLSQMKNLFDVSGNFSEGLGEGLSSDDIPDPNKLQEHITGMLDGKLGQLAREIAEETASDLNMDFDNTTDMKDVFQKLVKNPTKLMGLVKSVGDKLDKKMKSGEIKESELMKEATDIMNKMKNMPGMGNIQSMLSKMGLGGAMGGGGKMNMGAMEANLNQRMKMAQMKERMQAKAASNAKARAEQEQISCQQQSAISDEELMKLFSSTEKAERTPRGAKPVVDDNSNTGKKKKKGKK